MRGVGKKSGPERISYFGSDQDELAWPAHSTTDNLSGSRFRAVQCYDDPTITVVADLTRSVD